MTCIFCKIINNELPAKKIYEDSSCLAFLDIFPHALGHAVVIPKVHASTLLDLDDAPSSELILAVKKTMSILEKSLKPEGFNVGFNHHEFAGQAVPHLHFHILPRYSGDGGGSIHSIIKNPGQSTVDEVFERIKLSLKS